MPPEPAASADPAPGSTWRGFALADLQAAAGADWPEIADRPKALDALAFLLRVRARRDRGELPKHYTRPALCLSCGPVWLWEGAPALVIACPWCLAPPACGAVPRPPVQCGTCRHFEPSKTDPAAGLGSCRIAPALWPNAPRTCGAWRPLVVRDEATEEGPNGQGV